jgi:SSS family solute:Na+ symporter
VLPGLIAFHLFGSLDNADQAYPMLVSKVLPNHLLGFFGAVLFGAVLSSFNSALNSSVTLFGLDIYKSHINTAAKEEKVVKVGKSFGMVLALLSMCIAPLIANAPDGLFGYLQEVNGCYSIPILTIILVGYLTKYVPAFAAKIAIISGVVLYSISQFVLKPYVVGSDSYPHFLHVMAILFVFNVLLMLLIGKMYPRKEAYLAFDSKEVEIVPWKYLKISSVAITIIVLFTYFCFS